MAKKSNPKVILGLDVGSARIGVAVASHAARLPRPVGIISNDDQVFDTIKHLSDAEDAELIVIGLPRNMDGLETKQSKEIREFTAKLEAHTGIETIFADESLSSHLAEDGTHGYKGTAKDKHLDDVAACLILEEFFNDLGDK